MRVVWFGEWVMDEWYLAAARPLRIWGAEGGLWVLVTGDCSVSARVGDGACLARIW